MNQTQLVFHYEAIGLKYMVGLALAALLVAAAVIVVVGLLRGRDEDNS
jgi:hypothetical protein